MKLFKREKAGRPKLHTVRLDELRNALLEKIHELDAMHRMGCIGHDGYSYQIEEYVKHMKIEHTSENVLTIKIEKI